MAAAPAPAAKIHRLPHVHRPPARARRAGRHSAPATRCRPSTTRRAAAPTSGWTGCSPGPATTRPARWLMTRGRGAVHEDAHPGHARLRRPGRLLGEHQQPERVHASRRRPAPSPSRSAQRLAGAQPLASVHTSGSVADRPDEVHHPQQRRGDQPGRSPTPAPPSTTVQLRATSPYATTGSGNELTGQRRTSSNNLTTLFPRLSGDGFTVTSGGAQPVGHRRAPARP